MEDGIPSDNTHYLSKVTAKGQITLPMRLRQRLGIHPGDLVEVTAEETERGGVIEVRPRRSLIDATAGIARPKVPYRWREWDDVEEIAKDEVARRFYEEMNR